MSKAGPLTIPGQPFKMSETPLHASPALGAGSAANVAVLVDELGYERGRLWTISATGGDLMDSTAAVRRSSGGVEQNAHLTPSPLSTTWRGGSCAG